jgi:hypothetical protein
LGDGIMLGFIRFIAFSVQVGWIVGGLAIHLWAVLTSLGEYGFLGAVISFFMPIVAELFWMYKSTIISDSFLNTYNLLIIAVFIIKWGGMGIIALLSHQSSRHLFYFFHCR